MTSQIIRWSLPVLLAAASIGGLVTSRGLIAPAPGPAVASSSPAQARLEPIVAHARPGQWSSLLAWAVRANVTVLAANQRAGILVIAVSKNRLSAVARAAAPLTDVLSVSGAKAAAASVADITLSPSPMLDYAPLVQRGLIGLDTHATGAGQTIAIIGWGDAISDADLSAWALGTGEPLIAEGLGAGKVQWIPLLGGSAMTSQGAQAELAMDVEYAHAMAPQATIRVYLAPDRCDSSGCLGDWAGLEAAVTVAVADGAKIIAGSWGGLESDLSTDGTGALEPVLQAAAQVGVSFFFASGDVGSAGGVEYPASSPWAVAVGGATLNPGQPRSALGLAAWSRSGGGCSSLFARPSWQPAVLAGCANRAVPDLALDGDPNTGAPVYLSYGGQRGWLLGGGTSLAAPMAAALYADACAEVSCGWANPTLAKADLQPGAYSPVLTGSNGAYQAGAGWNAVTGWGVPNWPIWLTALGGVPVSQVVSAAPAGPTSTPAAPAPAATVVPPTPTATKIARLPRGSRMS